MQVLGIVPARGGSKGIPRKNLAPIAGPPLVAYTFQAARDSRRLSHVIVSTDDPAIAAFARTWEVDVPFERPAELAQDDTPMLAVLQHALTWWGQHRGALPEVVVLLQPTSPLRRAEHIDEAVDLLCATGADSVVSVIEVPHQYNPVSLMRLEDGRLVPLEPGPSILRRQDKPPVYARNGPAVLAVRSEVVLRKGSLYGDDCRPLIMTAEDSVDIDGPVDLAFAEFLLTRRREGNSVEA